MVGECRGEIEGISESAFINNTAWRANNKANRRKMICQTHRDFHGKEFKRKTSNRNKSCKYCEHTDIKTGKKEIRNIDYAVSEDVRKKGGKYLPFTSPICSLHRIQIDKWRNSQEEPMDDEELSTQGSHVSGSQSTNVTDSQNTNVSDGGLQDPDWEMEVVEENPVPKVRTLNNFLKDMEMQPRLNAVLHHPYKSADPSRKRNIMRVMASVNQAALDAAAPNLQDQLDIYEDMVKQRRVEKNLCGDKPHLTSYWITMIKEWNRANRYQRRQLAAMLSQLHPFSDINNFNPPKRNALREAVREAAGTESSEDEYKTNEAKGIYYFDKPFTKYMYRLGKFHVLKNGLFLAPAKSTGFNINRIGLPMLSAMYDFITSNEVTKATAFDTYQIRLNNEIHYVAKNIRNFSKEELARKLQAHLKGLGFDEKKIPRRTFMLKIINALPAKKAKQMRGVSIAVDEGKYKVTIRSKKSPF